MQMAQRRWSEALLWRRVSCFLSGNEFSSCKMPYLKRLCWLHTWPSAAESDRCHGNHVLDINLTMWEDHACGSRLSLMEFKGNVVIGKLYATVWLHHAVCTASPFQELIVCMQFSPWESISIIQEILGKVEGRTDHSQIVVTIRLFENHSACSILEKQALQLCHLCILYGFLISYLRQNMLLHILILMFRKPITQNVKYCPLTCAR